MRKRNPEITRTSDGRRRRVSATEAARRFSDVINRVRYNDEVFVVERSGLAVCEIRPVRYESGFKGRDLVELLRSLPSPGKDYVEAVHELLKEQAPAEDSRWRR